MALDPGLQAQRTALAWVSTGLSVFVNALLALLAGLRGGSPLTTSLGIALLAAAAVTVACGALRRRQLAASATPGAPPAAMVWMVVAATGLAFVAGAAAIVL